MSKSKSNSRKNSKNVPSLEIEKVYSIDYVNNETFELCQKNVLGNRSVEPFNKYDNLAKLSARGLHHRNRQHFQEHLRTATNTINQAKRQGAYDSKALKSSPFILNTYFRRAIAESRLGNLTKAIGDYGLIINVDPNYHMARFNRALLLYSQGKVNAAIKDLNLCIQTDPTNSHYIKTRGQILRENGKYMAAINDTMLSRAIDMQPNVVKDIKLGKKPKINMNIISKFELYSDPLVTSLDKPKAHRTEDDYMVVIDFLKELKFFVNVQERKILRRIAEGIQITKYEKDEYIFQEGDPGEHFYMIVGGEISIVKNVKDKDGEFQEITLVKLYRGHTFGDTALESKGGLRTAGAKCTNKAYMLTLHADPYNEIMSSYRTLLTKEVKDVLSHNELFSTWDEEQLNILAGKAVVKHFGANMELVKAGDHVHTLYIIKCGLLRIMKRIERPPLHSDDLAQFEREDPTLGKEAPSTWVLEKNWKDRIRDSIERNKNSDPDRKMADFVGGVLGSGQVFGELSVLDSSIASPVSVITVTQVEVYCFDAQTMLDLGARFNSDTMNKLNESINVSNPQEDKMAYYFRHKYTWENHKLALLRQIRAERDVNKK